MREWCTVLILALVFTMSITASVTADSGPISPPGFHIDEPGQQAVIAWNGTSEKLILSTDFRTYDQVDKFIRVTPFPSLPEVRESSNEVFKKVDKKIEELTYDTHSTMFFTTSMGAGSSNGVQIEWQKEIGAHNLTAYHVDEASQFAALVENKFQAEGIDGWEMTDNITGIIERYLQNDIPYFVMDVVDLEGREGSTEPLLYEFKTEELFYPLVISELAHEVESCRLAVFTPEMIDEKAFSDARLKLYAYDHMGKGECKEISPEISSMFQEDEIAFSYFSTSWKEVNLESDIQTSGYTTHPSKPLNPGYIFAGSFLGLCALSVYAAEKRKSFKRKFVELFPLTYLYLLFFIIISWMITGDGLESGNKYSYIMMFIFLFLPVFGYVTSQIIFVRALKEYFFPSDSLYVRILSYSAIGTFIVFALSILLSIKVYFDPSGAMNGFIYGMELDYINISLALLGVSLIPLGALIWQTRTEKSYLFYYMSLSLAPLLVGHFIFTRFAESAFCFYYIIVLMVSFALQLNASKWIGSYLKPFIAPEEMEEEDRSEP